MLSTDRPPNILTSGVKSIWSQGTVCEAIKLQRESLENPPSTLRDFLSTLQKQQLPRTASILRQYTEFI